MKTTSGNQIKVWLEGAASALQGSFEKTGWNIFKDAASYKDCVDLE